MGTLRRRRAVIASVIVATIAVSVVAFGYFEVQTLVIDDRVDESIPVAAAEPTSRGEFESLDHQTTGTAEVLGEESSRYVRFEDFETSNGPDLRVYLIPAGTADIDDAIDLGPLKGNIGDQNYPVPPGTDVTQYSRVLIWCVRFDSPFGAATLSPV